MPNLLEDISGYLAFSEPEVAAIFHAGLSCCYNAGETILTKDAVGDSMYILLQGEVEIALGFQESFALRKRGDYFGELSFLDPAHKRSASARATMRV